MKSTIRRQMLKKRDSLPKKTRALDSRKICEQAFDRIPKDQIVLCYVPMGSEVDVKPILAACPNVCVPRCVSKEKMIAVTFGGEMVKSKFGVLEPVDGAEQHGVQIAIVPGLAFDRSMNRIGYGAGYYDRYLSAHPDIYRLAVCFDCQLMDTIPISPWDVPMDAILTPTQVIEGSRRL